MASAYALLLEDGSLLVAEKHGTDWRTRPVSADRSAVPKIATLFVDGRDALGLQVNLPARNEKEALRAAPFAIEDDVAEAVDDIHVALNEPAADRATLRDINAVSVAYMENLSSYLTGLGLTETKVVAAHSVLGDGNTLVQGPGCVLGRIDQRTFTLDDDIGTDVLIGLCESAGDVSVFGEKLSSALGTQREGNGFETNEQFVTWLAVQSEAGIGGINLRQGKFQVRRSVDLGGFKQWRFAGVLAAAMTIGWFGSTLLSIHGMNSRTADLKELTSEFVNLGWPEAQGDTQRALALASAETGNYGSSSLGALEAASVLYDAMATVSGSELRSIRFDGGRGRLSAVVSFNDFADVDTLASEVQARGLNAVTGDARQNGNKVVGNISIGASS